MTENLNIYFASDAPFPAVAELDRWPWQSMKTILAVLCITTILTACSRKPDVPANNRTYNWTSQLTRRTGEAVVKGMLIDTNAVSADPAKPAFMAPPAGSKAYHGFALIDGIVIDGFRMGAVTDYLQSDSPTGCTIGDAFVEGPNGTRAGLVWEVGDERRFSRIRPPDTRRWGVYYFSVPHPVKAKEDMRQNFVEMLPKLKELYREARLQ